MVSNQELNIPPLKQKKKTHARMIVLCHLGPVRQEGSDEPGPVQAECFYVNHYVNSRFYRMWFCFSPLTLKISCQLHTLDRAPVLPPTFKHLHFSGLLMNIWLKEQRMNKTSGESMWLVSRALQAL